jgi:hypothetical protein
LVCHRKRGKHAEGVRKTRKVFGLEEEGEAGCAGKMHKLLLAGCVMAVYGLL